MQPRLIRLRDAPNYLGMDSHRFNEEVRPYLTVVPIGEIGIAFDRLDLDAWVDDYKQCKGRPPLKGRPLWEEKKMPGLVKRGNVWHINKKVNGRRISESTGSGSLEEAERYLVRRLEQIRQASVYGVRPKRTFREAATKYLIENKHKSSIKEASYLIQHLDKFIGDLPLENIIKVLYKRISTQEKRME